MNLPKSGKFYYALAGGAILAAGGALYLQSNALTDLRSQANQLRVKAQEQRGARAKLELAKRNLGDLQIKLAHLEQGIPDSAYIPTMLRELEAMGKTQNMEITGLRPALKKPEATVSPDKKAIDTKPYEPLDLELKGKASYSDLLRFVSALNVFPKILEVRTVAITPPPPGAVGGETRLDVTMGIRAFLFKQPAKVKKDGLST